MRVKSKKASAAARTLREMRQRHAVQCRRWVRQEAARCRYRGYFTAAVVISTGHFVVGCAYDPRSNHWRVDLGDKCQQRTRNALCRDRRAKKLAHRIRGMFCYFSVAPWSVARRWA